MSCNIYLDTSKFALIIRPVHRFSTHFSVSRSSHETLCVVIDELHLIFNNYRTKYINGVSLLSRPTFSRSSFWEGIFFKKQNYTQDKMIFLFFAIEYNKLVFFFQKKKKLEFTTFYQLLHQRTVNKMSRHF